MTVTKFAALLIIIIAVFVVLIYGQALLIPFIIAVLIWYLINALSSWLGRFQFRQRSLPYWVTTAISALFITLLLVSVGGLIAQNGREMVYELPKYEKNVAGIVDKIGNRFPEVDEFLQGIVNAKSWDNIKQSLTPILGTISLSGIIASIVNTLSGLAGNTFLIIIYVIFLFFEQAFFTKKIRALFPQEDRYRQFYEVLEHINEAIRAYFKVKITVSFITAFASYLLMAAIGLDFAIFWAFLIFLLNFIPNIGSLIATIFPAILSLVQYENTFAPFLIILVGVGTIQIIVGNFLEPRMMGSSLNISSLVVILALSLWGAIWGIAGMILCVPITVILMIILAQFPSTRPVAILLSEKGELMHELEIIHEKESPAARREIHGEDTEKPPRRKRFFRKKKQ
jgi:AI-2 transport protein TqsA